MYRDELLSNESTVRIKGSVQGTAEKNSELALEPLAGNQCLQGVKHKFRSQSERFAERLIRTVHQKKSATATRIVRF